jgi:hypothetical protein
MDWYDKRHKIEQDQGKKKEEEEELKKKGMKSGERSKRPPEGLPV